uniref:Hypothetical secreted peptide n=1 Tax=Simulium nigrimanum TaxID=683695 RepID=D1FQ36_SIMNI
MNSGSCLLYVFVIKAFSNLVQIKYGFFCRFNYMYSLHSCWLRA